MNLACTARGACALEGAPARGSAGCGLEREPGPVLAPARAARASSLGYFGRLRAPRAGVVMDVEDSVVAS